MKNRSKRLIVLLLSVLMVMSQMSAAVFALGETGTDGTDVPSAGQETQGQVPQDTAAGQTGGQTNADGSVQQGSDAPDTVKLRASGDAAEPAENGVITVTNSSDKKIRIVGTNKGQNRTEYVDANGGSGNFTFEAVDRIDAKTPVLLSGEYPGYDIATYDGEYAYSLDFHGAAVDHNYSVTVRNDNDLSLVKFKGNGGTGSMDPQVFEKDKASAIDANAFEKAGCAFLGWSTTAGGEISFRDSESAVINADTTLYAVWHTHVWKVDYNGDKATIHCNTANCPYGSADISIKAGDKTYDGKAYDGVSIDIPKKGLPEGFEVTAVEFFNNVGSALDAQPSAAGSYKAQISIVSGDTVKATISDNFTIGKRALTVKADDKTKTFGAPDPELTYTAEGLADGENAEDVLSGALKRDGSDEVGSYYIRQGTLKANDNYEMTFRDGVLTIGANISRVTKIPAAKEDLVFNGDDQTLIEAGEATGGTLYYYAAEKGGTAPSDIGSWSTELPKAKFAGDYDVWYRVKGDGNHASVPPQKITGAKIAKKPVEAEWSSDKLVYNHAEQAPEAKAYSISGSPLQINIEGAQTDSNVTSQGEKYTAKASLVNQNYELTNPEYDFFIYPKRAVLEWIDAPSYEYSGKPIAPSARIAKGVYKGDECNVSDITLFRKGEGEDGRGEEIDEAVDAGEYFAMASLDNSNYSVENIYEFVAKDAHLELQLKDFTITKAPVNTQVMIDSWEYGKEASEPSVTGNPGKGEVTYTYLEKDAEPGSKYAEWNSDVPEDAGIYWVHAVIAETENYQKAEAWSQFEISVADTALEVTMNDWTYGEEAEEVSVSGNVGGGELIIWYGGTTNAGEKYSSAEVPEEAGSYTVGVRAKATPNSKEATGLAKFEIKRAVPELSVSIDGWAYGKYDYEKNELKIDAPDEVMAGPFDASYAESLDGERTPFTWDEELDALDAGSYYIFIKSAVTPNYESAEANTSVTVSKGDLDIDVAAAEGLVHQYDEDADEAVSHTLVTIDGRPASDTSLPDGVKILYKTRLLGQYSEEVPTASDAGRYNIWYRIDGGRNYNNVAPLIHLAPDFTAEIAKADIPAEKIKVEAPGWTYGELDTDTDLPTVVANDLPSDYDFSEKIDFLYAGYEEGADISEIPLDLYTEEVPENAGLYAVIARLGSDANYNESISEPVSMEIRKVAVKIKVSMDDWTYGETPKEPVVTGDPGYAEPVFTYKVSGESKYTASKPSNANKDGEKYVVRATLPETMNYSGGYATDYFRINKAELEDLQVSIDGWTYRDEPNEPELSGNLGEGDVTYTYYKATADAEKGDVIGAEAPKAAGAYILEAVVEETDNYLGGTAEAYFVISKADVVFTAPKAVSGLRYTGEAQDLIEAGSVKGTSLKMKYSFDPEDGFTEDISVIKGTDAGTYPVYYKVDGNALYESTGVMGPVNVTIGKAVPEFTAPTPNVVKYDGKDHALLKAGTSEHGRFEYTLNKSGSGYSSSVPRATEAGKYTVYYKLVGDKNHGDTYKELSCEILKGDLDTKVEIGNWREGDEPSVPELTENPEDAEVSYSYKPYGEKDLMLTSEPPETAGHYTVVADIEATKNYAAAQVRKGFYVGEQPEAPTAKEGLVYNGLDQVLIDAGDAKETGTMMYSLDGEEYDADIDSVTGKNAGSYTVWYYVNGGEGYSDTEADSIEVSIAQADAEITKAPEAREISYTGQPQQLVRAGLVKGSTMLYNLDGGSYSYAIPKATDAGEYLVGYKAVGDSNHKDVYRYVECRIKKAEVKPVVRIEGWTYGDEANEPEVAVPYFGDDEYDENDLTVEYKSADADDDAYSETVPSEAGEYVVRATVAENDNYAEAVSEPYKFSISKADIRPSVLIAGWKEGEYNTVLNQPTVIGNRGRAEVTYLYKERDAEDSEYAAFDPLNGAPEKEGKYYLKAQIGESDNYNAAETRAYPFSIYHADPEVDVPPEAKTGLVYMADDDGKGVAQELVVPGLSSNDKGYFDYYVTTNANRKPGLFTEFSKEIPKGTDAGTYYVWYRFVQKRTLLPDEKMLCDEPVKVTIDKAQIEPKISMSGWMYKLYNPVRNLPKLAEGSNPGKAPARKIVFRYSKSEDGSESSLLPPVNGNVGTYYVSTEIPETDNYYGAKASTSFSITKAPATAVVSFNDGLVYNGKYQKLANKVLVNGGTLQFRVDGGNYTPYEPTALHAGVHTVDYKLEADDNHFIFGLPILEMYDEKTAEVEIAKAPIDPELSIDSWTYGEEAAEPVLKGNKGKADVSFEYRPFDAEDEAYEPFVQEEAGSLDAGDYLLRASVSKTGDYEGGEAVAAFSVEKAASSAKVNAVKGLEYDGTEQKLVNILSYDGGELQFMNAAGRYEDADETSVFYKTDAGEYEVTYRVKGQKNYEDFGPVTLNVKIAPAKVSGFEWSGDTEYTYDGGKHGVTAKALGLIDGDNVGVTLEDGESSEPGDHTAVVTGFFGEKAGNYTFDTADPTARLKWKIVKPAEPEPAPQPAPGTDPAQAAKDKAQAVEKTITTMASDKDTAGSVYSELRLRSLRQSKTSIDLSWTEPTGAAKYVLYGNRCGRFNKMKKITEVSGNSYRVEGLKKGKYHKFVVVALDKDGGLVSVSKVVHVATKGGKFTNNRSVKISKAVISKAKKLTAGSRLRLNAKLVEPSGKLVVNNHVAIRYESTNKNVASVSSKGVVKANKKGSCYVYAYAQSGIYKKIKVTVK